MAPSTIDSFFKPLSNTQPSNKRTRDVSSTSVPTIKAKIEQAPKTSSGPKLKKSKIHTWDGPHLSTTIPTTPNDMKITQEEWGQYYEESSSALQIMNTCGSEKWKKIESEELMKRTEVLLKEAGDRLAEYVIASALTDSEKKEAIAQTLKSLYSPFGNGKSADLVYTYHYRMFRDEWKYAVAGASERDISQCNARNHMKCTAELYRRPSKPSISGVSLFNSENEKTAVNLAQFEEAIFACYGWLSPHLLYQILCAGATATIYQNRGNTTSPRPWKSSRHSLERPEGSGPD